MMPMGVTIATTTITIIMYSGKGDVVWGFCVGVGVGVGVEVDVGVGVDVGIGVGVAV